MPVSKYIFVCLIAIVTFWEWLLISITWFVIDDSLSLDWGFIVAIVTAMIIPILIILIFWRRNLFKRK